MNLLRQHHAAVVPRLVQRLMQAAAEHWNQSVLKMVGLALGTLERMDTAAFDAVLGPERAHAARVAVSPPPRTQPMLDSRHFDTQR